MKPKLDKTNLEDLLLYECLKDSDRLNEWPEISAKIKKDRKAKFIPFEQFVEDNNIIRGQE